MIYVTLPTEEQFRLPFYLAMEEYIARVMPAQDYFFMWQVPPTVIFGRNQRIHNEVNVGYCIDNSIQFYRRKSGGGCVYADEGNIMLSYITPDTNVNLTFNHYMLMVEHALQKLGIEAKTTGRNDILIGGKKVSGNAFYHLPNRSIVHGTMLYDTDLEHMTGATTPSQAKLESKGVQSVRQHVTTIKEHLDISLKDFKHSLRSALCDKAIELTRDDIAAIEEIAKEYYTTDFIYGKTPSSTVSRTVRVDGVGEFVIDLVVKDNVIRKANLSGDFFIVGDMDGMLLSKLKDVVYTKESVEEALDGVVCEDIIMNLKKEQLINLLFN